MVRDYIDTNDFTKEELLGMVDLAIAMKGLIKEAASTALAEAQDAGHDLPAGSTRTRISSRRP